MSKNRILFNVIFCLCVFFLTNKADAWDISEEGAAILDTNLSRVLGSAEYRGEMGHLAKVEAWTVAANNYLQYKNIVQAKRHAGFSAHQGDPHAQWIMGYIYAKQIFVDEDFLEDDLSETFKWWNECVIQTQSREYYPHVEEEYPRYNYPQPTAYYLCVSYLAEYHFVQLKRFLGKKLRSTFENLESVEELKAIEDINVHIQFLAAMVYFAKCAILEKKGMHKMGLSKRWELIDVRAGEKGSCLSTIAQHPVNKHITVARDFVHYMRTIDLESNSDLKRFRNYGDLFLLSH